MSPRFSLIKEIAALHTENGFRIDLSFLFDANYLY
jgi:hypothetical protein